MCVLEFSYIFHKYEKKHITWVFSFCYMYVYNIMVSILIAIGAT